MKFDSFSDEQINLIKDALYTKVLEYRKTVTDLSDSLTNEDFLFRITECSQKIKGCLHIAGEICKELEERDGF